MTTYRKPTGRPAWPITLIAGAPKAGKSYAAAEASASPLITRTVWLPIGEDDPDELGALGSFDIAQHDGTVRGITLTISDIVDELNATDGTTLLVVDSMSRLWDMICDDLQATANERQRSKGRGKVNADGDATISMDLWNLGKSRWFNVFDTIRDHRGPSILTARMDLVTIVDGRGDPTKDKDWKIGGHKSLPFDVGAVVKMPARGEVHLTGVRSLRMDIPVGDSVRADGWTMHTMWERMGLADAAGERAHQRPQEPASAPVEAVQVSAPTEAENAPQEPAHDAAADALDRARQNAPQEQPTEDPHAAARELVQWALGVSDPDQLRQAFARVSKQGLAQHPAKHLVPDDAAAILGINDKHTDTLGAVIITIGTYVASTREAVLG